jgi:hypothetical protein
MTNQQKEILSDWYKTGKVNGQKVFEMSVAAQIIGVTVNELFAYRFEVDKKEINELFIAIQSLFDALTTVWEDNGNILADAVRDSVMTNLSLLTGLKYEEITQIIDDMIDIAQ